VLAPEPAPRAVVHVGAPKTGSTYLQAVLWRNRAALRAAGVLYPLQRPAEHFHATLDVREMSWGGRADGPWLGAWDQVAARIEAWDGSVVISNELLGGATPEQCRRVVDTLAGPAAREVHVVFTARDLARQLPSDWQEQVKHRHDVTLSRFVGDLVRLGLDAPAPFGELFWGLHDAAAVLGTWAAVVPVQQLHLVTLPHQRSGPNDLWERFARAAALERLDLDLEVGPRNESLGVAEAELLRLLTAHLRGRLAPRHYDDLVRGVLAETVLVSPRRAVPASERPTLPPEYHHWVRCRSEQLVEAVKVAGYDVVGDLTDLLPAPASTARQPEQLRADDLLPVALDALAGTLRHCADVTEQAARVRAELDSWQRGGITRRLVRYSDRHPWTMPLRHAFTRSRRLLGGGT